MKKIFFVSCLFSFSAAFGQRLVSQQALYWLRYQHQLIISPSFYWTNEIDNRRFFDPDVEHQLIGHSHLHYKKGKWDIGAGMTFSSIFAQKPENGYDHSTAEVRPVGEVTFEQPAGKLSFQSRIRVDNRFIEENQEHSVWQKSFYVCRVRYRAQLKIPLKVNAENITTVSLRVAYEIMLNNKKNTFDQSRIYGTAEFYVTKKLSIETGYLYIYQQRFGLDEYFSRHALRLSILHRTLL